MRAILISAAVLVGILIGGVWTTVSGGTAQTLPQGGVTQHLALRPSDFLNPEARVPGDRRLSGHLRLPAGQPDRGVR